jgi:dTDP-4-dehydrorhamnose reductase
MNTILLFGKNGQVGWELQRSLATLGRVVAVERRQCDMADGAALQALVRDIRPNVIVNAAAYTAVDQAESDAAQCRAINGIAPGILAEEAQALGAWLVHYSTDYVFDGANAGFRLEDDAANPLNVYGATKLEGERAVQQSGCRHLIFRTSWVYSAHGLSFAKTILRLARERETLKVVCDQSGAPTSAELIADVTASCLGDVLRAKDDGRQGLYHLVASGETTWHEYAHFIVYRATQTGSLLKCTPERIEAIPSSAYSMPAKRPVNSRLDTAKLRREFGVVLPDWRYHLNRTLTEIIFKENA